MQFAAVLQPDLRQQFGVAVDQAKAWDAERRLDGEAARLVAGRLRPFTHTTRSPDAGVAAADAGGAYPLVRYRGAAAVFTVSAGATFEAGADGRPWEGATPPPRLDLRWIPGGEGPARAAIDDAFARLGGRPLAEVIEASDYRELKAGRAGVRRLLGGLLRPAAAEAADVGVQLLRVAELGEALPLARTAGRGSWVLTGGTMALPYVQRESVSLYQEHLLRLVAGTARARGARFATLTGSHGLPLALAAERLADGRLAGGRPAEHWYLRLPVPGVDAWECPLLEGASLPPPGAVTFLLRFHAGAPVLRLDLDRGAWLEHVGTDRGGSEDHERELFEELDFYAHDLRAYGRPYPLQAAAARVHLSEGERAGLRSRLVRELASAGVPPRRLSSNAP